MIHILCILIVVIWGTTFVSTKVLLDAGLSPEFIFFLRFSIAYIAMIFVAKKQLWSNSLKHELTFIVLGLTGGSLYFLAENIAISYTYTSNVSLIVSIAPLLTLFLSYAINRSQHISKMTTAGAIIALLGIYIVITNGSFMLSMQPIGDILSLTAAALWAVYSNALQELAKEYNTRFITRKVFGYGLITILPVLFVRNSFDWHLLSDTSVILNLLFLSVIASLLCYIGWNFAIRKIGAVRPTMYVYFVPLITIVASSLLIDEPVTLATVVGTLITIVGVYISQTKNLVSLHKND
ncbi:MAG: DMT family transporter [Marinilabiliaceae bacterium]|nr:DMT family transporter [Marinilabiliaceae bacterium]